MIRRWARDLAAYGAPVKLRFGHEMNGNWYPWCEAANRNPSRRLRQGVAAGLEDVPARRRHERGVGLEPGGTYIERAQYPGDRYVDRLGLSELRRRPAAASSAMAVLRDAVPSLAAPAPPHRADQADRDQRSGSGRRGVPALLPAMTRNKSGRRIATTALAEQPESVVGSQPRKSGPLDRST